MSKITLRKLEPTDKAFFAKWWRDPELIKTTSGILEPITDEGIERYFLVMMASKTDYHFMIICGGNTIGHISLVKRDEGWYETQIVIGEKQHWGKGYATEAMHLLLQESKRLGVSKIFLEVRPTNIAAIHVYEKCGFIHKGITNHPENKFLPKTERMELIN